MDNDSSNAAPVPERVVWPETPEIHNRGMGPELRGTRIVMTDIYPWLGEWSVERIADWYKLTVGQVRAAVAYIEAHRAWVEEDMRLMRERAERGNPPEVVEKFKGSHERLLALRDRLLEAERRRGAESDARAVG